MNYLLACLLRSAAVQAARAGLIVRMAGASLLVGGCGFSVAKPGSADSGNTLNDSGTDAFSTPDAQAAVDASPITQTLVRRYSAGASQVAYTATVNYPNNPSGAAIVAAPIGSESAYQYFNQNIATAVSNHAKSITFPKSTYTITPDAGSGQHIAVGEAIDLIIDGQGSTLMFDGVVGGLSTGSVQGIVVNGGTRVVIQNFIIDYSVRIASSGTVQTDSTHCGGGGAHRYVLIDTTKYPMSDVSIQQAKIFNNSTTTLWGVEQNEYYTYEQPIPLQNGNAFYPCSSNFDAALTTVGNTVTVRHFAYDGNAISIYGGADVILQGITLYASPAMGVYAGNGFLRGIAIENVKIIKNPNDSTRLITLAADGLHFDNLSGDVVIENSEISYQGDDGLNITTAIPFTSTISGSQVTLGTSTVNYSGLTFAKVGDKFSFYDPTFTYLNSGVLNSIVNGSSLVMTFNSLPSAPGGFYLFDQAQSAARVYISDNYFHNNRGRGVITRSTGVSVANNQFTNNSAAAILVETDAEYFMEGALGKDMSFINNTIQAANLTQTTSFIPPAEFGALSVGVSCSTAKGCTNTLSPNSLIQNLLVQNNTISTSAGIGLLLSNVSSASVTNNTINDSSSSVMQSSFGGPSSLAGSVHYTRSSNVTIGLNTLDRAPTRN